MAVIIDGDTGITVSGNISTVGMTASGNVSGNNMSTSSSGSYKSSVALTPPTFKDVNNVQIGTLCRAWVTFNGQTGVTISSFNVSSLTRTGTGVYTIVFTNSLTDANYVVVGSGGNSGATIGDKNVCSIGPNGTNTANTCYISTSYTNGTTFDPSTVWIAIFR
jgi:hypothetical protein